VVAVEVRARIGSVFLRGRATLQALGCKGVSPLPHSLAGAAPTPQQGMIELKKMFDFTQKI